MWITEKLEQNSNNVFATTANVLQTDRHTISTSGNESQKGIISFLPFGIESIPPCESEVLLINADSGVVCTGCELNNKTIKAGELHLFSKGGANIILKNNGEISLNGLCITKDGQIKGG